MDSYHSDLTRIATILKQSPGSVTLENLLRLANFYKFETFNEEISPGVKRVSIAGKILVIDIDFHELESSIRGQTRIDVDNVKLILANNDSMFTVNNADGSIVLEMALKQQKLVQFDRCLEQLSVLDQNSTQVDLFHQYTSIMGKLQAEFPNSEYSTQEFSIMINSLFQISLASDERIALAFESVTVNDVGFKVEFSKPLIIPRHLANKVGIVLDNESRAQLCNNNDIYRTKRNSLLQTFQFVQSEFVQTTGFACGALSQLITTLHWFTKFESLNKLYTELHSKYEPLDRLSELTNEPQWFTEFTQGSLQKEDTFIKITVTDDEFRVDTELEYKRSIKLDALTPDDIRNLSNDLQREDTSP